MQERFFFGGIGSNIASGKDRVQNDYYATNPKAVEWLMKIEDLSHRIWEPACGEGHISKTLARGGHEVWSTDLIDRGFGEGGKDFLWCVDPFDGDIVTNPPYKLAVDFIYHALALVPEGRKVCMFLKTTFLEGKRHRELFDQFPPVRVWVSSSRISCFSNGQEEGSKNGSMISYAWYVWVKGYKGETTLKWFN